MRNAFARVLGNSAAIVPSLGAAFGIAFSASAVPMFQGLGDLPGGLFNSQAYDVSADGSVVVGQGNSASGGEAFRWTSAGMVGLGEAKTNQPPCGISTSRVMMALPFALRSGT